MNTVLELAEHPSWRDGDLLRLVAAEYGVDLEILLCPGKLFGTYTSDL